ncbi:MAG: sigma 54-interacting transcriptional regulator [Victivallales bacterium]|nr:sigma 54-interacting transcriptional regulator [Victivallales bacterium]
MVNLLFASSSDLCLEQICAVFSEEKLKGRGYKIFSVNTGNVKKVDSSIVKVMNEIGIKLKKPKSFSELPFKSIDILISIASYGIEEKSLFLPGYPTRLTLQVSETLIKDIKNSNDLTVYRLLRDEIEKLIEGFCKQYYLNALKDATETTRFILDSLAEGIIAHDMDRKITYFNKAAEEFTGYSRKEVIGRDCHDVFPGRFCGLKCAFCDGAPVFDSVNYVTDTYTKHGIKKSIEMSVVGIKGNRKELIGVLASFRDRTREVDLEHRLKKNHSFAGIIGKDPKMLEVFELIRSVADSKAPVLIYGASGTGKELVASAVHNESSRNRNRFVTVNCGAIPENLLESELFGHKKGAFTGAVRDKKGRFELADGGTIFLDEIGDISQAMQVKLLRVIQEGTFEKVGGEETVKVNVRVISATNKNLKQEIEKGRFREDLYYRLSVVPVYLPPLCERKGDIPLIAKVLLKRVLENEGRDDKVTFSQEALSILIDYDWPGNIRELQNWLQYALIKVSRGGAIRPEHFPNFIPGNENSKSRKNVSAGAAKRKKLSEQTVREALVKAKGNKVAAAKILGVGRATLYRFLNSLSK